MKVFRRGDQASERSAQSICDNRIFVRLRGWVRVLKNNTVLRPTLCLLGSWCSPVAGFLVNAVAQVPTPQTPPPEVQVVLPVDQEADQLGTPIRLLTLNDALRLGRANNLELRAAELLPQQAQMDLVYAEAAFNSEFYGNLGYGVTESPLRNTFQPSLQRSAADAALGWRQRVTTGGMFDLAFRPARFTTESSSNAFPDQQHTAEWSVSYMQPLLRGAWSDYNLADINTAKYDLRRSEQNFAQSVQDTLLLIVEAYWDLVYARENYRVVSEALVVAKEQLRITVERIRVRELAPRDRIADEAEVARREEERIAAENEIRRSEDNLRRLLFDDQRGGLWTWNLRPTEPIEVAPLSEPIAYVPLVEKAMDNRPDIAALRSSVAEAELLQLKAERDTLPQFDLVSSYSADGVRDQFSDAFSDSVDQQYPDWGLRLQFSIPVGNQAARSRQQRSLIEVERRQRLLYAEIMSVTKQVRAAVRNLTSYAQSILASDVSVRLAESNLETEQVKLRVGSSTAFEVQRRNQDLRTARSRHLRNQLDYRIAESRLLHAQGLLHAPQN